MQALYHGENSAITR